MKHEINYWRLLLTDRDWNKIYAKKLKTQITFYLYLPKETSKYMRKIWILKYKTKFFYAWKTVWVHTYNTTGTFWFNRALIDYLYNRDKEQIICVDTWKRIKYYWKIADLLKKWTEHKNYRGLWFELQVMFPISEFEETTYHNGISQKESLSILK